MSTKSIKKKKDDQDLSTEIKSVHIDNKYRNISNIIKKDDIIFNNGAVARRGLNSKNPNLLTIIKGPTKGYSRKSSKVIKDKKQKAGGEHFTIEIAPEVIDGVYFQSFKSKNVSPDISTNDYTGISLPDYPNNDNTL